MQTLLNTLIHRRWLMMTLFVLLSVAGIYAWRQLAIDAYPDIADVTVQVVTQVPGLAAEEIEQQITIPLERELNGLPRLHIMRSKNFFGLSTILLVFEDGTDDYWARQRVQERVNNVDIPYDAKPELNPLTSPTGEIYRYVVTGNKTLRELTELNRWVIIPRLRQIQGVADVAGFGGLTTQFQIEIDPNKLTKYNLSLGEVIESIELNNSNAGGSMLTRGDLTYVIRGIGLVRDLSDLGNIVVKTAGGAPIYIKDLGELKYGNLERKGILGFVDDDVNIEDGVEGMVQLLRYENPSLVLDKIHKTVEELNADILPKGVKIHTFLDRTHLVNTTLNTVSHTLFFGILLVIGILIIFLGSPRGALLAALTIPFALLFAFIMMFLTDIPINLLSLGAIDFGIVVDGAIVVMETILRKREDHPNDPLEETNIAQRVSEVIKPMLFSTLIIIVAYLPLFAFDRVERKLFTPMAFTMSFALLGAALAALMLIPGLTYAIYRKPQKVYHNRWLEKLTVIYKNHTAKLIQHPKRIIIPIIIILIANIGLSIHVGKDFLSPLDEGSIWIQVQLPPGTSLAKSSQMATTLRNTIKNFEEVSNVMTQTGRDDEGVDPFSPSHIEVLVGLRPYDTWKSGRRKTDLINDMAAMIETMPGYEVGFSQPIIDMVMDQIAGAHSDLAIKIYGEDLTESRSIAEKVKSIVENIHGSADVSIEQEPPLPQLQIIADRDKIAKYGLNVSDVAELIEIAIGGKAISQVFIGDRLYDVICRYSDTSRDTPEKIGALTLVSASGAMIPLSAVAEIKTTTGANTITREMNRRFLTVRVNLRGRDLASFLTEARSKIDKQIKYDHTKFQVHWGGQYENQQRAYSRLAVVVPMALAVMFLLLFFTFGKFRQAGLLIGMLPIVIFGGMLALVIRGMTFNVSSAVGFIALFGLSIQNGVIMLSHINILRKRRNNYELRITNYDKAESEDAELKKSVIEGASHRLRPMLMTASVAILGLLPASLATNIGSDVQRPLATVIVYGLLAGTVISLYLLPMLYYFMESREIRKRNTN
jgi:cobalt-zinc-cadmium resistance protein CzcA